MPSAAATTSSTVAIRAVTSVKALGLPDDALGGVGAVAASLDAIDL
jgi:hypothetical protein